MLARRAASDPDDAYVRMARTDGLLTALTALAAGTDEEDAREAWAELDVLRRTRHGLGGTHAPLFPAPDACDVVAELEVRIINLELENAYFKSKLAVPVVRSKFAVAPPFTPIPTFSEWCLAVAAHALVNLSVDANFSVDDQRAAADLLQRLEAAAPAPAAPPSKRSKLPFEKAVERRVEERLRSYSSHPRADALVSLERFKTLFAKDPSWPEKEPSNELAGLTRSIIELTEAVVRKEMAGGGSANLTEPDGSV